MINRKYGFLMIFICFLIVLSCDKNDLDYNFTKLVNIKKSNNTEIFPMYDLLGIENIQNKYYRNIYFYGKSINDYLLDKAYSERDTNWYYYPVFSGTMKEGDIAIVLFLAINNDINFLEIVPVEILDEYNKNGAGVWWEYLHNNREKIINLIRESLKDSPSLPDDTFNIRKYTFNFDANWPERLSSAASIPVRNPIWYVYETISVSRARIKEDTFEYATSLGLTNHMDLVHCENIWYEGNKLKVDFSSGIIHSMEAGGSAVAVSGYRELTIFLTLLSFPDVEELEFYIEGAQDTFWSDESGRNVFSYVRNAADMKELLENYRHGDPDYPEIVD